MSDVRSILYKYGQYIVRTTDDHYEDGRRVNGYEVLNTDTNIVEETTRQLYLAMNRAQLLSEAIDKVMKIDREMHDEKGDDSPHEQLPLFN